MKEIKIVIRIDDKLNRVGFALERDSNDSADVSEVLKVIGALDLLKQREMSKLDKGKSFKMRK